MLENIKQEEIEFPVALAETLFPDFDNFQLYNQKEFGHIRTGQLMLMTKG